MGSTRAGGSTSTAFGRSMRDSARTAEHIAPKLVDVLAKAAETLDTYGHLWPDGDDWIRAPIDSVFCEAEEPLRNLGTVTSA